MLSRPICPEQGMPIELDECIYRCFEAHRRRVIQRRAERRNKQKSQYSSSSHTQQDQNILPEQTFSSSHYSNIMQDASQYETSIEPSNITIPSEVSPQSTWEYSNIDQSTTLPMDTNYQAEFIHEPLFYEEPKNVQFVSQKDAYSSNNTVEQPQLSTDFKRVQNIHFQPPKTVTYTEESAQYQVPTTQVFDTQVIDQQVVSTSRPTGTIEYTREAYFSQTPTLNQSDTISYEAETQSLNNQQYADGNFPSTAEQTYDQTVYTNEQSDTQQQPLQSYEESQQNFYQQSYDNQPLSTSPVIKETDEQQDQIETNLPSECWFSSDPSRPLPPPTPSDNESNGDEREDEEILDLRACICRCYARFQNLWMKDQQERYEEQFSDIQRPISAVNIEPIQKPIPGKNMHHIYRPIPTSMHTVIQPSIPSSICPLTQQFIQQSNTVLPIYCDHTQKPQENLQISEIEYTNAATQTPPCPSSIQPLFKQPIREQITSTYHTIPSVPEVTTTFVPSLPTPTLQPLYQWTKPRERIVYKQVTPICPPIECPSYAPTIAPIPAQPQEYQNVTYHTTESPRQEQFYTHPIPPVVEEKLPLKLPRFEQLPISIEQPRIRSVPIVDTIHPIETAQHVPYINVKADHVPVICPESITHVHLPPPPQPELRDTRLPSRFVLPTPPVIPVEEAVQAQPWCVRCCCAPGKTLIKKVVYKQVQEDNQQAEESYIDYGSVIDQLETSISIRHGDSIMEEGEAFVCGNYNEQLRIIDFPVYISEENDIDMRPLIPNN